MKTEAQPAEHGLVVRESAYRQGSRAVVPESKGQKFRVRLMGWAPGATVVEGSSADYPVDVIARDFPQSHPAGTRMRANHDSMCEAGGDIRRIFAKTVSEPVREIDGMYADAIAAEGEASDFIRQFADVIGTSITASVELQKQVLLNDKGEPELDENEQPIYVTRKGPRGLPIVERFMTMSEAPYNSVDFVEVPGADGAVVTIALESAKRIVNQTILREAAGFAIDLAGKREKSSPGIAEGAQPGTTPAPGITDQKEFSVLDQKDKDDIVADVIEALKPLTDFVTEQKTAAAAAEAGDKPADAPSLEAVREAAVTAVAAIEAANLPSAKAKAALMEAVTRGEDITAALEFHKEVAAESAAAVKGAPSGSTFVIETASSGVSLGLGGRR